MFPDEHAGMKEQCPECGEVIIVPDSDEEQHSVHHDQADYVVAEDIDTRKCPYCGGVLDGDRDGCGWSSFQVHHMVVLVSQGGTEALKNLRLLHDVCHRQLHACHEETTVPVAA